MPLLRQRQAVLQVNLQRSAQTKSATLRVHCGRPANMEKSSTHVQENEILQIPSVPSYGYFNGKKLVNRLGGEEIVKDEMRKLVYEAANEGK